MVDLASQRHFACTISACDLNEFSNYRFSQLGPLHAVHSTISPFPSLPATFCSSFMSQHLEHIIYNLLGYPHTSFETLTVLGTLIDSYMVY